MHPSQSNSNTYAKSNFAYISPVHSFIFPISASGIAIHSTVELNVDASSIISDLNSFKLMFSLTRICAAPGCLTVFLNFIYVSQWQPNFLWIDARTSSQSASPIRLFVDTMIGFVSDCNGLQWLVALLCDRRYQCVGERPARRCVVWELALNIAEAVALWSSTPFSTMRVYLENSVLPVWILIAPPVRSAVARTC